MKVLAINGSYRDDVVTDQLVEAMTQAIGANGHDVDTVLLRDYPIEFCLNCRECTQQPGTAPGKCVHDDGMQALIDKIESADAYILASPTNFGSVTALFKRFMERLVPYAYWPWGMNTPKFRKARAADKLASKKKAITVSSSAAPAFFGRWLFSTRRQLKMTARVIGADTVGDLTIGLVADEPHRRLSGELKNKAEAIARKLIRH